MSILKNLGDMDGKPILYATIIGTAIIGAGYLLHAADKVKTEGSTWQRIEQADRFVKALPPALVARIEATQAKHDPECGLQYDVTNIPDSFRVIYAKAERDGAGMLTAPCTHRPETAETFYAGADYPQARDERRN